MSTIIWGVVLLLFVGAEIFAPTIEWLFLAAGALLTSLLTILIPGLDQLWWLQILIWSVTSFSSLFVFRKFFKKAFVGDNLIEEFNKGAGDRALVIEAINPDAPGRIKYKGTSWPAISDTEEIAVGQEVEILEHRGMVYLVTHTMMEDFPEEELQKVLLEKQNLKEKEN